MNSNEQTPSIVANGMLPAPASSIGLADILSTCSQTRTPLPESFVLNLAENGLKMLVRLHGEGRVYGPITPGAFVFHEGGGADLVEPDPRDHRIHRGTFRQAEVPYLAPEAVLQSVWIPASDVFSLGIVLWECLTGLHPFRYAADESVEPMLERLARDVPLLPPTTIGHSSDRGLLALASAMLVKDPDHRPQARDLLGTIRHSDRAVENIPVPVKVPPDHPVLSDTLVPAREFGSNDEEGSDGSVPEVHSGGSTMASIKCEQCGARLGWWSFKTTAYIFEEDTGFRHYFCSPECCDFWCNEQIKKGYVINRPPEPDDFGGGSEYYVHGRHKPEGIASDRFICPGCGERATAKNSSLCPSCGHFVHHGCSIKGFITWSCPICNVGLVGQT